MREFSEEKKSEDPSDHCDYGDETPTQSPEKIKSTFVVDNKEDQPLQSTKSSGFTRRILSVLLLDFPLFTILTLYAIVAWARHVQVHYLEPQVHAAHVDDMRRARDITYYMRQCDIRDLSTTNGADLFLPTNATADEAYEHQLTHGFTVFRSVLKPETASALRDYALSRNRNLTVKDSIYVIENENRYSFGLGTEEPSVTNAITELTSHPQLNAAVEKILGPEPALIEMTTITISYGAVDQWWHGDVTEEGSPVRYARTFGPSYSIFIQLQNTTKEMGATGACPGTMYCARDEGATADLCDNNGFQLVNEEGHWATGDALLMNMNSWHRGGAHIDPDAGDRVMLILTVVPKPKPTTESRLMSQGITFSLRWDMWGHTWSDLRHAKTAMTQPWATLRALGLYKPKDAHWGIDFVTGSIMRLANEDTGFDEDAFEALDAKGGLPYLPRFLQDGYSADDKNPWLGMLQRVCQKVYSFARLVVALSIALYLTISRLVSRGSEKMSTSFRRLGLMCALVYIVFGIARIHVDNTKWAKDIRANRRYSSVFENEKSFILTPSEVTTFPTREDVLFENRLDSDFLHIYQDFVDQHPGNRVFHGLVNRVASTYDAYPAVYRDASVAYITDAIRVGQGRFLEQGFGGKWFVMSVQQTKKQIKKILAMRSSKTMHGLLKEIGYSISGYRFGVYRRAVIGNKHVVPYLRELEQKLLDKYYNSTSVSSKPSAQPGRLLARPSKTAPLKGSDGTTVLEWKAPVAVEHTQAFKPLSQLADTVPLTDLKSSVRTPSAELVPEEPFAGAWISSGSQVEGLVDGFWYIGTVQDASAHGKFYVTFPDGDHAVLDRDNTMRPYKPYRAGERLSVLVDLADGYSEYVECQIVERMEGGTYRVQLSWNGDFYEGVEEHDFRRQRGPVKPKEQYTPRNY